MITDKELQKLIKKHSMAKRADESIFAEQRNNILVKAGKHHKKRASSFNDTMRGRLTAPERSEIRITKNHIPRVVNIYKNAILDGNPSVTVRPYNKDELSDNKAAELANSVLQWIKRSNKWKKKQRSFVEDYITIGETFAKVSYDPTSGDLIDSGFDELGNPIKAPAGQVSIDKAFGFDIKIDPSARDFDDARWLIHESIVDLQDFKDLVKELNPEKLESIKPGIAKGHHAFDGYNGVINEVKDKVVIMEYYLRPDSRNPQGKYVMFVKDFIVTSSKLPFGLWNWVYLGFDEMITSPRSTSIIKICRPYQIEINRSASKMAEHQITLGDDKVFIQKGTRLSSAGNMAGIRSYTYAGEMPVIQQGRSGAQYLEYQVRQITEMYEACNLAFVVEEKAPQGDPYQMLYTSMKDKKRFSVYSTKYEDFEVEVFEIALKLAQKHLSEGAAIKVLGSTEIVNISEFKKLSQDSFDFFIEPMSGDIETKFGEVLRSTSILQYAGSSLKPEQLGRLIKDMPFGSSESLSSSLTSKQDYVDNTILALDRGEIVPINEFDDHDLMINALSSRMTKSDFKFLSDDIKSNYTQKIQLHTSAKSIELENAQKAEQGFIPSGGFLTTINASWVNPSTGKVERIKAPSESVQWLMEKLQQQGIFLQEFKQLPGGTQSELGNSNNNVEQKIPPIKSPQA